MTKKEEKEIKVSPLVERLTGVIPKEDEIDYKKDFNKTKYLNFKG